MIINRAGFVFGVERGIIDKKKLTSGKFELTETDRGGISIVEKGSAISIEDAMKIDAVPTSMTVPVSVLKWLKNNSLLNKQKLDKHEIGKSFPSKHTGAKMVTVQEPSSAEDIFAEEEEASTASA